MRALLFDIDGTLTKSHGAGTRALAATLHTRPRASEELKRMRLDGMTDRAIVRILLAAELGHAEPLADASVPSSQPTTAPPAAPHEMVSNVHDLPGPPTITERARSISSAAIEGVIDGYLTALAHECKQLAYKPQPGIPALLDALSQRTDVLLGLCTGNVVKGAELKLTAAGLWHHFSFGGFGSDDESRPELVKHAVQRARDRGATEFLVIDDTPRGVLAAHEGGAKACGVATGRWSVHDLRVHGAEMTIESFADLDRSLALLLGPL
ncbi:MAG: HAD family hydrolase [Deltaproteobacteria bacterium]|nr:HAD family hydrolase [Deltaproteobacteria bacterium]